MVDDRLEPREALSLIADTPLSRESLQEVLAKVISLAKRSIPGTDSASITTIVNDHAATLVATGSLAERADTHQYESGRGPCMESALAQESILVVDMEQDDRWPQYAVRAAGEGVRSSLSVPLPVQDQSLAALNLYAEVRDAFDAGAQATARQFAQRAGVAVANAQLYATSEQLAQQLQTAMKSRATIEQAKGILMVQSNCGPEAAFELLVRASQRENAKLRDIAQRLVENVQRPTK